MSHTYEELKKKTVAELRDIAAGVEHEAVKGYSQLNKEHLLVALCKALNIDMHTHHKIAQGEIKMKLKLKITELKKARDEAVAAGKSDVLKHVRRRIHFMKRSLRKAAIEV
jgi:alpha-D-ribose 1-methylphosphonate 5-triphosphate synthase subunit PhnG